jgi:hypothetical protein
MSADTPEADITPSHCHVRFVPNPDMSTTDRCSVFMARETRWHKPLGATIEDEGTRDIAD